MSEKSPKNIKNTCKTIIYKFRANSKKAQQVNPSPFKSAQVPWTYFLDIHIKSVETLLQEFFLSSSMFDTKDGSKTTFILLILQNLNFHHFNKYTSWQISFLAFPVCHCLPNSALVSLGNFW